jgi:hypothetical protein
MQFPGRAAAAPQDTELAAISQRVGMAGNAIETFSLADAGF